MKFDTLKFTALLFIMTTSLFSCHKDDNSVLNSADKFRLSKILKYSNSTASKLTGEVDYAYDEKGNMVKESFYDCNPAKILWMYREYEYSENKKIKEKIFDGASGNLTLGSFTEYIYNGNQLLREETYCGRGCDGSLINSMNYEYDERGNIIRKYMNDPVLGILGDMKYTYDNQNKLILEETAETGVSDYYYKYLKHIYDNNSREIKLEYYNTNQDLIRYTEKVYKETSILPETEIQYDKNGSPTLKYRNVYDEWGNLTETIINDNYLKFKRKYNGTLLIEEINYWEQDSVPGGQTSESGMSRYEYENF